MPNKSFNQIAQEAGPRGVYVFALVVSIVALVLAWLAFNPAEEAHDRVGVPVAQSLGIVAAQCPNGWLASELDEEHLQAKTCSQDPWVVTLTADGSFSHAINTGNPNAEVVYDPEAVPGWQ